MKRRFTEDSWRKEPWFKSLSAAMQSCKTDEEMANFLRDIATLSELQAMGERLEVAKLLAQGMSYRKVAAQTGASTTTVTRVAHFLENGEGGYRKVLNTHRHHRMKVGKKVLGDQATEISDRGSDNGDQRSEIRDQEVKIQPSKGDAPSPIKKSALQKYLGK
jgi:TrpR-related protein YerC/YecD